MEAVNIIFQVFWSDSARKSNSGLPIMRQML